MSVQLEILERIARVPTAPTFESGVVAVVKELAAGLIPNQKVTAKDGNLMFHYSGDPNRESPKTIAYLAHTDHPGFSVLRKHNRELLGLWRFGGLETHMLETADVAFHFVNKPFAGKGEIVDSVDSSIYMAKPEQMDKYDFATLELPEFEKSGNMLLAPALDDYAGIAMALAAFVEIIKKQLPVDVRLIFTVGEELGMAGAYMAEKEGWVPKDSFVYSVDMVPQYSRNPKNGDEMLETAIPGDGPIVNIRDLNVGTFSLDAVNLAVNAYPGIQALERFNGACDGTYFMASGYRAAALGIPVVACHNNGTNYGKRGFIREEVNVNDFNACSGLLIKIASTLAEKPLLFDNRDEPATPERADKIIGRAEAASKYFYSQGIGK